MDWTAGESAPVRLIAHSDGREFGTGFAVLCDSKATWLVTCAHVVDTRAGTQILVSGRLAEIVANGRDEGRDRKIDLAVLRVPGLQVSNVLPVAPLDHPLSDCSIPGWYKHAEASYRSDCLKASVGNPFSWTEPRSSLIAQAFELAIGYEGRLAKGYSGAPAICSETGAVFAVVATKEEPSTSGSAICIEYLLDVWPDMPAELRTALAAPRAYRPTSERAVEDGQTKPTVSSPKAEMGELDIRAARRRVKERELGVLLRDWEDTVKQSGSALAAAERNRLDRQAAEIWERIEALERELRDVALEEPRTG